MNLSKYRMGIIYMICFALFSIMVLTIDVHSTGQVLNNEQVYIGFYSLNIFFKNLIGFNQLFYVISDIILYLSLFTALIFFMITIYQFYKRKSFINVDFNLRQLMLYYFILIIIYLLFDKFLPINYRPVSINGNLSPSYPSTHSLFGGFIFLSSIIQIRIYIKNKSILKCLSVICYGLSALSFITRMISGVHWFTDLIGSLFLVLSILYFYKGDLIQI